MASNWTDNSGGKGDVFVLLVGQTGAGKTHIVNYLANLCRNGNLNKPPASMVETKDLKGTETGGKHACDNSRGSLIASKVDCCTTYTFHHDGHALHIIDTPNLDEIYGSAMDEDILSSVIAKAESVPHINAIWCVADGAAPKLSSSLNNVLVQLRGRLPDALLDSLMVIFTNCTCATCNFDLASFPFSVKRELVFHVENSAFSSDPQLWTRWPQAEMQQPRLEWARSLDAIRSIVDTVTGKASASSKLLFEDLRRKRGEVKCHMADALGELRNLQKLQDLLQQQKSALSGAQLDVKRYAEYTKKTTFVEVESQSTPYHNTCCQTCQSVCHGWCSLGFQAQAGHGYPFNSCACMERVGEEEDLLFRCTMCKGRCPPEAHYHSKVRWVKVTKTVEEVLHDTKAKYDAAQSQLSEKLKAVQGLECDLAMVKQQQDTKMKTIERLCYEIQSVCSSFNFVAELASVITTLRTGLHSITSVETRRDADASVNKLEALIKSLSKNAEDAHKGCSRTVGHAAVISSAQRDSPCVMQPH